MKYLTAIIICFSIIHSNYAQNKKNTEPQQIQWHSFEDAMRINKQFPKKKIFIDVYTDWCGWCKKMDATTFTDTAVIRYMNEHYYAVKLNAERKDSIMLDDRLLVNPNPNAARSTHQLAEMLLNGRLTYPSYVFLDEMNRTITVVPGYLDISKFMPIIHYFGDNEYFKMPWETYQKSYELKNIK